MKIDIYNFETGHQILRPIVIVQRNNDARTLSKLWMVLDMYGTGRNQLLLDKIEIGE